MIAKAGQRKALINNANLKVDKIVFNTIISEFKINEELWNIVKLIVPSKQIKVIKK